MKPAPFTLVRPQSLEEALSLLAEHGEEGKIIAGGQSLVPVMNLRMAQPEILIDLNRVDGLAGIAFEGGRLRLGGMVRQAALIESALVRLHAPLLAKALPNIGHVQTRSRGTIGGSLAHADPSAELPLVMVALDAELVLASAAGRRIVPARGFFLDAMETVLQPDEMIVEISVPASPPDTRCCFRELARRRGDFAIVAVAAQRTGEQLVVALGGVETVPFVSTRLNGETVRGRSRDELGAMFAEEMTGRHVMGDLHASADYRAHLAGVLVEECLREVLEP